MQLRTVISPHLTRDIERTAAELGRKL